MSFITILLIAIGLSMDSLAVSISGGLCLPKFTWRHSLKMAAVMGGFQGGMTWLGWLLGSRFSAYITQFDHWIAFVLLGYLGGKMIYESFQKEEKSVISFSTRMLLTLGVATSIDALAVGISMAFLQTGIWMRRARRLPLRANQRAESRASGRRHPHRHRRQNPGGTHPAHLIPVSNI